MLTDVVTKTSYVYKITLEDFKGITHLFEIETTEKVEEKDMYRLLLSNIRDIVYDYSTESVKIYDKDNLVQIVIPVELDKNTITHLIRILVERYNIDKDLSTKTLRVSSIQGITCLIAVLFDEAISTI